MYLSRVKKSCDPLVIQAGHDPDFVLESVNPNAIALLEELDRYSAPHPGGWLLGPALEHNTVPASAN
jgi:hypothetical protein